MSNQMPTLFSEDIMTYLSGGLSPQLLKNDDFWYFFKINNSVSFFPMYSDKPEFKDLPEVLENFSSYPDISFSRFKNGNETHYITTHLMRNFDLTKYASFNSHYFNLVPIDDLTGSIPFEIRSNNIYLPQIEVFGAPHHTTLEKKLNNYLFLLANILGGANDASFEPLVKSQDIYQNIWGGNKQKYISLLTNLELDHDINGFDY